MYTVIFMTQAQKDAKKLTTSGLKKKALKLLYFAWSDFRFYIRLMLG